MLIAKSMLTANVTSKFQVVVVVILFLPRLVKFLQIIRKMSLVGRDMDHKAIFPRRQGGDCVETSAGKRQISAVVDADEIQHHFPIAEKRGRGRQCRSGGDYIIVDYHLPFRDGSQQVKFRSEAIAVYTLHCIVVECNAETCGHYLADIGGEVEGISVAASRSGDDGPSFRISDKTQKEV